MAELVQTAANVIGIPSEGVVAGATITAGMPVYEDTTDDRQWKPARANALATAKCGGIALNNASDGQPLSVQSGGDINLGATLTVGETYCVSDATVGKIIPIADYGSGDYPVILGIAKSASLLKMGILEAGVVKP